MAQRREDAVLLARLPALLGRLGYHDVYCMYGALHTRFAAMRKDLPRFPPILATLVSLWLLGETVPTGSLQLALSAEMVSALARLGVLVEVDGGMSTAGLALLPILGRMVFVPRNEAGETQVDDAAVLAARACPRPGARSLDLCSGTGIKALGCLGAAREVVAVESNPILVGCIELSFAINDLAGRAEVRDGDLYGALAPGERFDHVIANPPVLAFPPRLLSASADPDDDGLGVLRRVLSGLPAALAPGGTAQLLGCAVGGEAGPELAAELAELAERMPAHIVMTVPARVALTPGAALFEQMVAANAAALGLVAEEVQGRLAGHFGRTGGRYLYPFHLTVSLEGRGMTRIDHFKEPGGFWFR